MSNKQLMRLKVACKQLQLLKNRERIYKSTLVKAACKRLLIKKAADDPAKPATAAASDDKDGLADYVNGGEGLTSPEYTYSMYEQFAKNGKPNGKAKAQAQLDLINNKINWKNYNNVLGRIARWFIEDDSHRRAAILYMTNSKFNNDRQAREEWLQNEYGELNPDMRKRMLDAAESTYTAGLDFGENLGAFSRQTRMDEYTNKLRALQAQTKQLQEDMRKHGLLPKHVRTRSGRRRPYDYSQYDIMADAFGYAGFPYHSRNWLTDNLMQYDDVFAKRVYDQLGIMAKRPMRGAGVAPLELPDDYDADLPQLESPEGSDVTPMSEENKNVIDAVFGKGPGFDEARSLGILPPVATNTDPYDMRYAMGDMRYFGGGGPVAASASSADAAAKRLIARGALGATADNINYTPDSDTRAEYTDDAGSVYVLDNSGNVYKDGTLIPETVPSTIAGPHSYSDTGGIVPMPPAESFFNPTAYYDYGYDEPINNDDVKSNADTMEEVLTVIHEKAPWIPDWVAERIDAYGRGAAKYLDDLKNLSEEDKKLLQTGMQIYNKYLNQNASIENETFGDIDF